MPQLGFGVFQVPAEATAERSPALDTERPADRHVRRLGRMTRQPMDAGALAMVAGDLAVPSIAAAAGIGHNVGDHCFREHYKSTRIVWPAVTPASGWASSSGRAGPSHAMAPAPTTNTAHRRASGHIVSLPVEVTCLSRASARGVPPGVRPGDLHRPRAGPRPRLPALHVPLPAQLLSASHQTGGVQLPEVEAHITGTVWKIEVEVGDSVEEGDTVVILESMKMEMPVEAEDPGRGQGDPGRGGSVGLRGRRARCPRVVVRRRDAPSEGGCSSTSRRPASPG